MSKSLFHECDLICFSHLRWNFVYQRPQHLMSRFSAYHRVFVIEEPVFDAPSPYNEVSQVAGQSLWIVTPHLPNDDEFHLVNRLRSLLDLFMRSMNIKKYYTWYYSPLALKHSSHLNPVATVYDCMDELSAFRFAPRELKEYEAKLLHQADVVFTGGHRLFEAKQHLHDNIYSFPSSIDKEHFMLARTMYDEPDDQRSIPHPRIGFYGVIDERFNIDLVQELAQKHKRWHFVLIGPTAKIDVNILPKEENIHFLGQKDYNDLPAYLAGWDVAMMPFALNESTKYISPTKTPEYLAGGKPVVSTSIRDVVIPYGENDLVFIADTVNDFAKAIEEALENKSNKEWLQNVDRFLANISWDKTFFQMSAHVESAIEMKINNLNNNKKQAYV